MASGEGFPAPPGLADPTKFPSTPALAKGRTKGPEVYQGLDQEELDAAYDQAVYAANLPQVVRRRGLNSAAADRALGEPSRLAYGPTPVEGLDHFPAPTPRAPVVVFVHGGAWRAGLSKEFHDAAELMTRLAGAHYLVADFTNVVEQKGDLMPMARQVRQALAWTVQHAADFGGDPDRVYVTAHSSGSHLASAALVADWGKEFGLPQNAIKGAVLTGGMYDLKGPRLSKRSEYVKFTDEVEDSLSAIRHLDMLQVPLVLAYGSQETPEFQRQTWAMAEAVRKAGKPVQLIRAEGYNHFELPETFAQPFGILGRALLAMLGAKLPNPPAAAAL